MRVPVEYASLHAAVWLIHFFATIKGLTPPSVWCRGRTSMFVNTGLCTEMPDLHFHSLQVKIRTKLPLWVFRVYGLKSLVMGHLPKKNQSAWYLQSLLHI